MAKRGFQPGKANAYHRLKAENEALKQQIQELKERPTLIEFGNRVGTSIMVILAGRPFEVWPDLAKAAFRHEQRNTPTTAHMYLERLPQHPLSMTRDRK